MGGRPRPPSRRLSGPTLLDGQCSVPALEPRSPRVSVRTAWPEEKVPSLDFCKLLGGHLIICSNPSGVFSTVTHSVVQVVQVVREPLLDRSSLRHVVATAQPLNRSAPDARHRHRALNLPYRPNRSTTLRHVIATAQPLRSAPRHRCRSTAQVNRSTAQPLKSPFTLTFSCHSYFFMSLLLSHVTLTFSFHSCSYIDSTNKAVFA